MAEFDFDKVEEGANPPKTKPELLDWEKELEKRMLKVTKNYQSDFYKHDVRIFREAAACENPRFPAKYMWMVRENGTNLLIFGKNTTRDNVEGFINALSVWSSDETRRAYTGTVGGDIFPVPYPHIEEVIRDLRLEYEV